MKAANRWLLFGVIMTGLIHGHASLRAQPTNDPAPAGGDPAPTGSDPAPTGGDSTSTGGDPAPTGGAPVPAGGGAAPWNQGVAHESRQAARDLFLEGNRLMKTLLFAKAAEKYVAALSKWKHPRFYFNLALAQIGLGQEVEARESLEHALAHGAEPLGEQEFKEAQKKLQEVTRQLGRIRVTCETPGAEVTLDGVTLFIGPGTYQGWAKAKAHELTAKKVGYLSEARRVTVSAGKLQEIELKLVTLGQATDASRRWAVWKPWAVVAAGGLIAAGGAGLHALAARGFDDYDKGVSSLPCAAPSMDRPTVGCTPDDVGPDLDGQLQRARRQQVIAVSSYVVGGSLVATGIVLLYMNRPRTAEQPPAGLAASFVEVTPVVSSDMLGLLVSRSY